MKFEKGHDFLEPGCDHKTFGINCIDPKPKGYHGKTHYNKVVIYADEELRDKILEFLETLEV